LGLKEEEKAFSWFLCGKRILDEKSGMYILRLSRTAKFYDVKSGHTLVPVTSTDPESKTLGASHPDVNIDILIVPDNVFADGIETRGSGTSGFEDTLKKYGYRGIADLTRCSLKNPDQWVLCHDVSFSFLEGAVEPYKKESVCEMIMFAKRYNPTIRERVSSFPDVDAIDASIKTRGCSETCKKLYPLLLKYVEG
jgi:hypothetical protein